MNKDVRETVLAMEPHLQGGLRYAHTFLSVHKDGHLLTQALAKDLSHINTIMFDFALI